MDQPIVNPPNPYVGTLRIFPGTMVKVSGRPRPNATSFAINFQTGPSLNPRDDLALHLSPSFTPPRIVRNSLQRGAWGLEEAWGNGTVMSPHAPFEIIILAEPNHFKIAVNGGHYCEFRHRIPYPEITHLTIDGDVIVDRIVISSAPYQPPQPAYQPASAPYPSASSSYMPMPATYPTLPSGGPQPTGASSGYPAPSMYPNPGMPAGPMPTGSSYMAGGSAYPQAPGMPAGGPTPYPASMPGVPGPYPTGGPNPTGAGYQGGYPTQPHPQHQQPGHSSSSPFGIGGKTLGTLAGLGLAGAAGAAVLSAANPLKLAKKMVKHKGFKHKGFGRSSSSSSNSSRSSFSSNSS